MAFLSLLAKKYIYLGISRVLLKKKKEPYISQILLKLRLIGIRISCRPIRSVLILVIKQIGRPHIVNHSYDYRPNWTPLSPVTISNKSNRGRLCLYSRKMRPRLMTGIVNKGYCCLVKSN